MRVYISIQNFGDANEKKTLCDIIGWNSYVSPTSGHVIIACEMENLGDLFAQLEADERTNWIEYTLQFM